MSEPPGPGPNGTQWIVAWSIDVAAAYCLGIVLGAPFGLTLAWVTGVESMLTIVILSSMALVLATRRGRSSPNPQSAAATLGSHLP
jgi:hypothetical protein